VNRLLISGRDYLDQTLEMVRMSERARASGHTHTRALFVLWACALTQRRARVRAARAQFLKQRQRIIEEEERAVREGRPPGSTVPPPM
jgi:hypothetical protein